MILIAWLEKLTFTQRNTQRYNLTTQKHRFPDSRPLRASVKAARESVITGLLSFWRDNYKSWESNSPQMITGRVKERVREREREGCKKKNRNQNPWYRANSFLQNASERLFLGVWVRGQSNPPKTKEIYIYMRWTGKRIKWQPDKEAIQTFPFLLHLNTAIDIWMWI